MHNRQRFLTPEWFFFLHGNSAAENTQAKLRIDCGGNISVNEQTEDSRGVSAPISVST
jgi:hypothetical protein